MRFMTVAVDDSDITRCQQGLDGHLVRGRRSVGDEEYMVGAERTRGHLLRLLDIACRLKKAVEASGGGAAFSKEQSGSVEFAHVANPIGLENGLAASDRKGVERADRPLRILLQVVEERCIVSILHAFKDGEMK